MDDPVRRRSFVRLATAETIQTAGRLAGMSALAGNLVAKSLADLAGVGASDDPQPNETTIRPNETIRPNPPAAHVSAPRRTAAPTSGVTPRLDAATTTLLATTDRLLVAVNRSQAGPLVLPFPASCIDGVVHIPTRDSSAMAQAIRSDGRVTLLLDDPDTDERVLVFGTARLLEGPDLDDDPSVTRPDPERARIVVTVSHALRTPR